MKGKLQKLFCLLAIGILASSLIAGFSSGSMDETLSRTSEISSAEEYWSVRRPSWQKGDHWNYTYHLNTTDGPIESMYETGTVNYTVEGERSIVVGGTSMTVYHVISYRNFRAVGEREEDEPVGTVTFDLSGYTKSHEYYRRSTLELVAYESTTEMEGISDVTVVDDFELDMYIIDNSDVEATQIGDFYSFPIRPEDEWRSESRLDIYANSYTNMTSQDDLPGFPRSEEDIYDYEVIHDHGLEAIGMKTLEVGDASYDAVEIKGTDQWTWKESDVDETGHVTTYFSQEVGNAVYTSMENIYDDNAGVNVTDATYTLDSYSYEYSPPEDFEFDDYVEGDVYQCKPGEEVTYQITVENRGKYDDTLTWEMENCTYILSVEGEKRISIQEGESKTFEVTLTFSEDSELDTTYKHTLGFRSMNDPSMSANVILETWICEHFLPVIESRSPRLRNLIRYSNETVELSVGVHNPEDDDVIVEWYIDGELYSEGNEFDKSFQPGEYTVTVRVTNQGNHPDDYVEENWNLDIREPETPQYFLLILLAVIIAVVVLVIVIVYIKRDKIKGLLSKDS